MPNTPKPRPAVDQSADAAALANAGATGASEELGNRPERLEWLQDAGFGIFIHWSMDSQLGCVISHTLVGASEAAIPELDSGTYQVRAVVVHPRLTMHGEHMRFSV